jgi:protein-disulfide isomerase
MQKKISYSILLSLVLLFFLLYCSDVQAVPPEKKDNGFTSFGNGKIKVRLYADYFCVPCSAVEPKLDPVIKELVTKNIINITFIDAPFHKYSSLYVRYFLYAMNEKREFHHALAARGLLFEAAKENITEEAKLEEYLNKSGIKTKPFGLKPAFASLEGLLKEDRINSTPACVIYSGESREVFTGGADILKALEGLKPAK